jgi:glycosyltransferase involved in cell wall biosynthesis
MEVPSVIKGKDIVMVGLQPWYFTTGCNAKDMAIRLAENNRVLYVNFPLKRKTYLARNPDPKLERHIRVLRDKEDLVKPLAANLWEFYPPSLISSVNWLPTTVAHKAVNYFNNRRFARDIQKATARLGFRDIILFNDNDVYNGFFLKKLLAPSLYIYYFRDFLQGYDYWKKHASVLEPELLRQVDMVVANSTCYAEYSLNYNAHSYYIGQGCNFEFFDASLDLPVPDEVRDLGRPIIGYIGALDSARLDLDIIRLLAKTDPTWKIVLVGPEDEKFYSSDLHSLPNVYFPGRKPFSQLASYVKAFDVCINPQLRNEITRGNYPLKIDEYLAMGKPVVATRTLAMKIFESHTYLADDPGEFPALVQRAITENSGASEEERIRFARSHTWENVMENFYKAVINTTKS